MLVAANDGVAEHADVLDLDLDDVAVVHAGDAAGVPVMMTSPGSSVVISEIMAIA